MTFTDPIADLLTRIRNADMARHESLRVLASREKRAILDVLQKEGFVAKVADVVGEKFPTLEITLRPERRGLTLRRISSPGRRVYSQKKELSPVRNGLGIRILSTPHGVMSHKEAIRQNVGGEIICEVF